MLFAIFVVDRSLFSVFFVFGLCRLFLEGLEFVSIFFLVSTEQFISREVFSDF